MSSLGGGGGGEVISEAKSLGEFVSRSEEAAKCWHQSRFFFAK